MFGIFVGIGFVKWGWRTVLPFCKFGVLVKVIWTGLRLFSSCYDTAVRLCSRLAVYCDFYQQYPILWQSFEEKDGTISAGDLVQLRNKPVWWCWLQAFLHHIKLLHIKVVCSQSYRWTKEKTNLNCLAEENQCERGLFDRVCKSEWVILDAISFFVLQILSN